MREEKEVRNKEKERGEQEGEKEEGGENRR